MQLWVYFAVAIAATHLQLTSDIYDKVLSSPSQTLLFLSTGEELYAAPNLPAFSILLWLQLHNPLPSTAPVLSLTSEGLQALRLWIESGEIKGECCSACRECVIVSLPNPTEAYKWVHVGVIVDSVARNLTLTVTPWKTGTTHVSGHIEFPLLAYHWENSKLRLGGFAVSAT